MGVVYKAEDPRLGRFVALKFLSEPVSRDPNALERLRREARAASALNHPHICTIHDIDEFGGHPFIVMELLEGRSLSESLQEGPVRPDALVRIVRDVAEALAAAHAVRIVHRDVKPANIFLTTRGDVKVLDFGVAKVATANGASAETTAAADVLLTTPGTAVGTIAYMSPEQALGRDVDGRADLFSLGVVAYEMATGRPPFGGPTVAAVFDALLHETPVPANELNAAVPEGLARIISRALEKDPSRRYASAADFSAELALLGREPPVAGSASAGSPAGGGSAIRSLAVLAFIDLSPGKDHGHLCQGVAEELMTSLAHIRELRVAARTSTFALASEDVDALTIAKRLGVDAVVQGTVQKAGSRLRITAQLVDGRDGAQRWGGRYEREDRDIFAVQDDVAAAIIEHLQIALVPDERAGVFRRRTSNLDAHRLYLEGLECLWKRSSAPDAIVRFGAAIEKDASYAQAYWGLSDAYLQLAFWSDRSPTDACRQVKQYARRALALDPGLGDPHGALSYVHLVHDWDVEASGREIREALRLSPNSSMVHAYYSWYLLQTGRVEEGVAEALRAQALDPASSFIAFAVGLAFAIRGDLARAIEEFRAGLAVNPHYFIVEGNLGLMLTANRQYAEAVPAFEAAIESSGRVAFFVAGLANALEHLGRKTEAWALWAELGHRSQGSYVPPICFVMMHGLRGELVQLWRWLQRAGSAHDSYLPWFRVLPAPFFRAPREPIVITRLKTAVLRRLIGRVIARYRTAVRG
jgi:TolB-like protein/Tfp pilus assembly protein PilF